DLSRAADPAEAGDAAANANRGPIPAEPGAEVPPDEAPDTGRGPDSDFLKNPTIPKPPKLPEFTPAELGEDGPPIEIDPESPGAEPGPKESDHDSGQDPGS